MTLKLHNSIPKDPYTKQLCGRESLYTDLITHLCYKVFALFCLY